MTHLIYTKNCCKCNNACPPSKTIKKENSKKKKDIHSLSSEITQARRQWNETAQDKKSKKVKIIV
jgi:hypothetical protein